MKLIIWSQTRIVGKKYAKTSKIKAVMSISREISIDIMKYLQKEGMSVDEIANAMRVSSPYIQKIIDKKTILKPKNINSYIKNKDIRFWEFITKAVPKGHLTPKLKKKLLICKELSDCLKKRLDSK